MVALSRSIPRSRLRPPPRAIGLQPVNAQPGCRVLRPSAQSVLGRSSRLSAGFGRRDRRMRDAVRSVQGAHRCSEGTGQRPAPSDPLPVRRLRSVLLALQQAFGNPSRHRSLDVSTAVGSVLTLSVAGCVINASTRGHNNGQSP